MNIKSIAIACSFVLGAVSCTDDIDPWALLPPSDQWPDIVKSLENEDHVRQYVRVYMAPFRQLQNATRDASVKPDTIKISMLAMLDLAQQACSKFNVTQVVFEKKQKSAFRAALDDAVTVFEDPAAQHMEPVFKVKSIKYFMFQRLDDMLVTAKSHKALMSDLKSYCKYLRNTHRSAKDWNERRFKYLIPRNLDLKLVKDYSVQVISVYLDKKMDNHDLDHLKFQLHSLGNDANKARAGSRLLVAISIIAIVAVNML